ncbi:ribosome assembly factor mrt4 [Staphylotrichum tortipilum]|uniref:Ribosome assembly factor mrt4 n=1 Tax=Staphylotrichum tortipilum TaxID=2831512 RepID=A0AAN6MC58_9PEZI|nr:ribosome assembly factor mrt4 [Staphylotrichum longicolle]
MPKSKRAKVYNLTQVSKKTRENKDKLFANIRECIPQYQHCFVFSIDNMRNNYLKDVRRELSDCRIFFGKTKLTARALGTTPEDAQADGLHLLTRHLSGSVGLLFTNRDPSTITDHFASLTQVDFARAGTVASRTFTVPPGLVYSTGGEVPAEHDVPVAHTLEPELRRLGMPTRMVKGKVCLGGDESGEGSAEGYTVCREGQVLDSRQTRLLKLFSVCMSEFRVDLLAYWSAASGEVTELEAAKERAKQQAAKGGDKMDEDEDEEDDE